MGNLDPYSLLAPRAELQAARATRARRRVRSAGPHLQPRARHLSAKPSVDQVRALVDFVHEASAR